MAGRSEDCWSVLTVILLIICFVRCKETVVIKNKAEEKISLKRNLKALVTNKYFWCVLGLWSIQVIHITIVGTDLPYYCKYIFGNDSWIYVVLFFLFNSHSGHHQAKRF